MNFCQFEKDPRIYLKQLQKKRSKKTSKPKTNTKNGVFKRTKLKATIKPKVSVDKYKQKLEGMIETCVQTRFTKFTKEIQKTMMEMKNGNTNAKMEKDVESLKNNIQKIISRLPDGNAVNKDIHYLQQNMEQVIEQIQNLQVDISQLKQEVVPIVRETIDPWDDGHGNQLSSPREIASEPANKDTTPEPEEKTAPEPDNIPETTTNEIVEEEPVVEEPVAKAN